MDPPLIQLALFGKPVAQSLSPRIHGLFARQVGIRINYRAIEADRESLAGELDALAARGGSGCNITVPLKQTACRLADHASDRALRADAANILLFEDNGRRYADNTDGEGLVGDLAAVAARPLAGLAICLLGAGGAAAGVLGALLRAWPERVVIANRTVGRAAELARRHSDLGRIDACSSTDAGRHGPFDLVINATSLGHADQAPVLTGEWVARDGLVYDLNYGRAADPLRRLCAGARLRYADGLGMLVGQAALSFRLWTGLRPDPLQVLAELRAETGKTDTSETRSAHD